MAPKIRFGIMTLQNLPVAELIERWELLDWLGWDSVWLGDHFVNPFAPTAPWLEGWTLLAALAGHTRTIRIGTLVTSISLRNPVLLARQAMTVDHLSGGRLNLGIGAAGRPLDYTMPGNTVWDAPERVGRFREYVELVDQLLRNPVTTFRGKWYAAEEAVMNPAPVQKPRPPLTLAAHGPSTLKIVARYADTWNSLGKAGVTAQESFEITRERNRMLDEFCAAIGRDPREITRSLLCGFTPDRPFASFDAFHEFVGKYREIGINEFIFYWMPEDGPPSFPTEGLQGARITNRDTLERFSAEALPVLRDAG